MIKNDELNVLSFDRYFSSMRISKKQKQARIDLGEEFLDLFLFIFAYAKREKDIAQLTAKTKEEMVKVVPARYKRDGIIFDSYIKDFIALSAVSIAKTTIEYGDGWYTSYDRAFELAANQANAIENYGDYKDAVAMGCTVKVWLTENDERVRPSHAVMDGEKVPIDVPFNVGGSLMRFPGDTALGASPSETCNCRCSLDYE